MLRKNKLRKNKRKVQEDDLELQITSLADILIIVLVFLLKKNPRVHFQNTIWTNDRKCDVTKCSGAIVYLHLQRDNPMANSYSAN